MGSLLALIVALIIGAIYLLAADSGGSSEPLAIASPSAAARPSIDTVIATTPTATPEPTPTPFPYVVPQRRDFVPGELIDVSPAVVFADPDTGAATAWVFSEWTGWEFGVGPSGGYVVYGRYLEPPHAGAEPKIEYRLLSTDDGSDRELDSRVRPIPIGQGNLPVAYGPGNDGFALLLDGGSALGVFDGRGRLLFDVPLASDFLDASWSQAGGVIAIASRLGTDEYDVRIQRLEDGAQISLVTDRLPFEDAGVALGWSHAGNDLAVVAPNRVFVIQPRGARLWEAPGDIYWGNPRWSKDDSYLFVNASPGAIFAGPGPEVDYVFTNQGVPLFRILSAYVGGCAIDPWLSDTEFQLHEDVWSVSGEVIRQAPSNLFAPDLEAIGVSLDAAIGSHIPHGGAGDGQGTDDGRVVFTTPEIGTGGCGELFAGLYDGPVVQQPPFGDWAP